MWAYKWVKLDADSYYNLDDGGRVSLWNTGVFQPLYVAFRARFHWINLISFSEADVLHVKPKSQLEGYLSCLYQQISFPGVTQYHQVNAILNILWILPPPSQFILHYYSLFNATVTAVQKASFDKLTQQNTLTPSSYSVETQSNISPVHHIWVGYKMVR